MQLLMAFLLTSVLGLETAHASRPSSFAKQAVQRMAHHLQPGTWVKAPSYKSSHLHLVRELVDSLGIAWDADYALRPDNKRYDLRAKLQDWLLQHRVRQGNPQVLAKLFKLAVLKDDVMSLDWMKDNLFTDTEVAQTILTSVVNEALPSALRVGAGQAAVWLVKHGADVSVLKATETLRTALQGYLVETLQLSLPLAQHASNVDKHSLNDLLPMIVNNSSGLRQDVAMMEHLQMLGAKLTAQEWQDILLSTLTKSNPNWLMANFVVVQGADINALDLNNIISNAIAAMHEYKNIRDLTEVVTPQGYFRLPPIDIVSLFDFLRLHGVDRSKLDVAQLRSIAEEKNNTEAIEQLQNVNQQVEQVPAEEILQQLYAELTPPSTLTYDAEGGKDFLLYETVKDYWDKKSFAWLVFYIGKVCGASTLTDMLVETIHFTPNLGYHDYNEKMDGVFEILGLAEQKEELAQVLLNRLFHSKEIHPFPLSFARWAVSNGANINHPDQNTVARAIINNEEINIHKEDYRHIRTYNINDIIFFLEKNHFNFDAVDDYEVMRITEASDAAITTVLGDRARKKR